MKLKLSLCCLILLSLLTGCQKQTRRDAAKQLHNIAKDWCLAIRASQIIPITPIEEDFQVGDIYLVDLPVETQSEWYFEDGFLPIRRPVDRIHIESKVYKDYYKDSFMKEDEDITLPHDWFLTGKTDDWKKAPGIGFPEYSFAVNNGAGANIGIAVNGVSIGSSFLNAANARGTIAIKQAKTYGLDLFSIQPLIEEWAKKPDSIKFLQRYAADYSNSKKPKQYYIRIVSKVCLAKEIAVSVNTSKAFSLGASVGDSKPVDLIMPSASDSSDDGGATANSSQQTAVKNYTSSINNLNEMLTGAVAKTTANGTSSLLPGGTVKIQAVSANSILMSETFDRPYVIGYIGYDMAIDEFGILGPPIATLAVLEEKQKPKVSASVSLLNFKRAHDTISKVQETDKQAKELISNLKNVVSEYLPKSYPVNIYKEDLSLRYAKGAKVCQEPKIPQYAIYNNQLRSSQKILAQKADTLNQQQKEDLAATGAELKKFEKFAQNHRTQLNEFLRYAYYLNSF